MSLSCWKQALIILLGIILFPLVALLILFYFTKTEYLENDVSESSINMIKERKDEELEKQKRKDKQLEKQLKELEKKQAPITKKISKNISNHETRENYINKAETIKEIRRIMQNY